MTFSIIIPAFNAEKYIQQTVDSILNQTNGDFEILIADDGSKDGTRMIIDKMTDTRIKRYHNIQNLGYLKTCNKLMTLAKGDFIVFQDADDLSLPTRLEEQYRFITENGLDACGTWVDRIDEHDNFLETLKFDKDILSSLKKRKFDFVENSFMVKKSVVNKIGYYHPYFDRIGFEDFYWTARIAFNYKVENLQKSLYLFRDNPVSVTTTFSNYTKEFSFRSVMFLLDQKLDGFADFLEQKKEKKLKEEVIKIMLSSRLNKKEMNSKEEVRRLTFDLLKNNPLSLLNWKIALKPFFK